MSKFEESTVFKDGRYEVRLPFKMDPALIGDNYRNAVNRLGSLLKQLEKNRGLLLEYNGIIQEQLKSGVIEVAPTKDNQVQLYYLPHRTVIKENKKTTSVRMVFDARAKSTKGGLSINDVLEKGFYGYVILRKLTLMR